MAVCALLGSDGPVHNTVCTFSEAMFGQMAAQHLFEQGYRFGLTIDISVRVALTIAGSALNLAVLNMA